MEYTPSHSKTYLYHRNQLVASKVLPIAQSNQQSQLGWQETYTPYGKRLQGTADDTETLVFQFILERFRAWYAERNIPAAVVNAVLAKKPARFVSCTQKCSDFGG